MKNRPIYENTFSRDFTLVNMEIWWRGEVFNDKIWTNERQPFLPYVIFEKTGDTVNSFYDPKGIEWIKKLLLKKVKEDDSFCAYIEKNFIENLDRLRAFYNNKVKLNHDELCQYLDCYEKGYVWFEAGWWLWGMTEIELDGTILPDSFRRLRVSSQDYVPRSEALIRNSLAAIYSELGSLVEVLRISEIKENIIPVMSELKDRKKGYFFVDNKLYTGLSRKDIERKYNIEFEKIDIQNINEFVGNSAYKGKIIGKVKIILSIKNLNKIEDGDVLVSTMTLPDFLPAIKKSAALVTDEGGMLSHAAIVAREMKKPCIIGTKIATKVLRDGDIVEVNADKGIVKIIKKYDDKN